MKESGAWLLGMRKSSRVRKPGGATNSSQYFMNRQVLYKSFENYGLKGRAQRVQNFVKDVR